MPWRFHKSIRIAKGVRVNLSKKGASVTVGGHGLTQTYGHGKVRTTVGLPGTGVSYTQVTGKKKPRISKPSAVHQRVQEGAQTEPQWLTCPRCKFGFLHNSRTPRICPQCGYGSQPRRSRLMPSQPLPPPSKVKRPPPPKPLVIGCTTFALLFICLVGLIALTVKGTPSSMPSVAAKPLAEHLTFQGDISGMLTTGIDPHPITHDNPLPAYVHQQDGTFFDPAPPWTQCSDFEVSGAGRDAVAVIVGNVGTRRYAITIEINEDNPAYMKPGTELRPGNINSGGSVKVYETGGQSRRWQQVYGPTQQEPVIILHADRTSGTVDAWMATTDQSQKSASASLHLQGDWRCG